MTMQTLISSPFIFIIHFFSRPKNKKHVGSVIDIQLQVKLFNFINLLFIFMLYRYNTYNYIYIYRYIHYIYIYYIKHYIMYNILYISGHKWSRYNIYILYICVYICIFMYIYIYIYIHSGIVIVTSFFC